MGINLKVLNFFINGNNLAIHLFSDVANVCNPFGSLKSKFKTNFIKSTIIEKKWRSLRITLTFWLIIGEIGINNLTVFKNCIEVHCSCHFHSRNTISKCKSQFL